jgi:hypothetical protein
MSVNEQEPKTVTPYEMLEAMLLAISPDDYEEALRDFAEEKAENAMEAQGIYVDRDDNMHDLTKGTYISIADLEACLIFLAETADELSGHENGEGLCEIYVKHLLEEHLRPGELNAFATLCCFHDRIGEPDIGGDWIYIVGNNRDDEEENANAPLEERCLLHADAVSRVILALGKYLEFRDQVETTIEAFMTKYDDIHYPE